MKACPIHIKFQLPARLITMGMGQSLGWNDVPELWPSRKSVAEFVGAIRIFEWSVTA